MTERAVKLFLSYAETPWEKIDLLYLTRHVVRNGQILNSVVAPLFAVARGST